MKKIMLPVDGSEPNPSYNMAKLLATQFGATLVILSVDEPVNPAYMINPTVSIESPPPTSTDNAKAIVDEAAKFFEDSRIKIVKLCRFGDAASVIIEVSEEENCDLIIMYTHGMSAVRRFLLGSVTNKVVHHATKPVLIVR